MRDTGRIVGKEVSRFIVEEADGIRFGRDESQLFLPRRSVLQPFGQNSRLHFDGCFEEILVPRQDLSLEVGEDHATHDIVFQIEVRNLQQNHSD